MERNALDALAETLESLAIRWVLIGALAANRYRASPRLTQDVDLLLADTGAGLDSLEAALTRAGWSVRRASAEGDLLRLQHAEFGTADLLIAGTDYQHQALQRSRRERLSTGADIRVLTVEDVIIHKLIAGRSQDIADIEAIVAGGIALDTRYLDKWLEFWALKDGWNGLQRR